MPETPSTIVELSRADAVRAEIPLAASRGSSIRNRSRACANRCTVSQPPKECEATERGHCFPQAHFPPLPDRNESSRELPDKTPVREYLFYRPRTSRGVTNTRADHRQG